MSAHLDLDDVCAGHPVALAELESLRRVIECAHAAQREAENELSRQMARAAMREGELRAKVAGLHAELERLSTVVPITALKPGEHYHALIYRRSPQTGQVVYQHIGATRMFLNPATTYGVPTPPPTEAPRMSNDHRVPHGPASGDAYAKLQAAFDDRGAEIEEWRAALNAEYERADRYAREADQLQRRLQALLDARPDPQPAPAAGSPLWRDATLFDHLVVAYLTDNATNDAAAREWAALTLRALSADPRSSAYRNPEEQ